MKMIIKVIDRLHNQLSKPTGPSDQMPGWMNDMYKKFTNIGNEIKGKLILFYFYLNNLLWVLNINDFFFL